MHDDPWNRQRRPLSLNVLLRTWRQKAIFFVIWLSFGSCGLAFFAWDSNHYARFSDLAVCITPGVPAPTPTVIWDGTTPHICGKNIGNAGKEPSIWLCKDGERSAYREVWIPLGRFSEPVSDQTTLEPGHYTARLVVLAGATPYDEVYFTVVPPGQVSRP